MLPAIDFYNQSEFQTHKVDDVTTDQLLPTELPTIDLALP
jgi:hypothetical protein|tara:strand:- start:43421 stop:43540 length:120 start_codon:yes stop_codon:yes gene_type:complete